MHDQARNRQDYDLISLFDLIFWFPLAPIML
jgi:hypothetical protein